LEDNTGDNNTKHLPKSPEKTIYYTSKRETIIRGKSLYYKTLYTKEYSETSSSNKRKKDLKEYIY
jgi:hypothetical protein